MKRNPITKQKENYAKMVQKINAKILSKTLQKIVLKFVASFEATFLGDFSFKIVQDFCTFFLRGKIKEKLDYIEQKLKLNLTKKPSKKKV